MRAPAPAPQQPSRIQRPPTRDLPPEAEAHGVQGLLHDEPALRTSGPLPAARGVAPPGDPLERDAARAADRVGRGERVPIQTSPAASPPLVARSASGPAPTLPPATARAVRNPTGGAPLPDPVRSRLESGFRADLSGVRLHDDAAAHRHAESLRARAFTYGPHIWLSRRASPSDIRLLAHETAHVLQHDGLVRRDPDPEAEAKDDEKPPGVSNKYEVNFELKKAGKHSGSIRFAFQTRSGGVLEAKGETEGNGAFVKGKALDNKVAYKRAAGKGGHQIAAALGTVEAGVKPFPWLSVSVEAKALEGQIKFSGEQKLSLLKLGVKVKGTAPEAFLEGMGLPTELARAVTVTVEGKYEYAIPPEDLGRLHKMYKAAQNRLYSIEEVGKSRAEMEKLLQEQEADTKKQKGLAERDKLRKKRRTELDAKKKADKDFGLKDKEKKLKEMKAKQKKLAERNEAAKRKLKDKKRSPRKNKPKRTVSPQNRGHVKAEIEGRRKHMKRLQGQIDDLERDVRKHKRKHPTPKKSAKLKRLDKKLADFDARRAKRTKAFQALSDKIKQHEKIIRKADDVIAKAASGMKSKAGKVATKVLGKQLKKAAGKLIMKLGAKLIPGLNIISTAADLFEIGRAAYYLYTGQATLGLGGGGDPSTASKDGVEGGTGTDAGAQKGDAGTTGDTDAGTGNMPDAGTGGGDGGDATTGETGTGDTGTSTTGDTEADGGDGVSDTGTTAGDVPDPFAAPETLHPRTKALIEAGGQGLALDGPTLQALDDAVPKDIPEAEFQKLLEAIKAQKAGSAEELVGRLLVATQPEEPQTPEPSTADDTVTIDLDIEPEKPAEAGGKTTTSDTTPAADDETPADTTKTPTDTSTAPETPSSTEDSDDKKPASGNATSENAAENETKEPTSKDTSESKGNANGGDAEVDAGAEEGETTTTASGGPLVLTQSRALGLLALVGEGKTKTLVKNTEAIAALKAETVTASDGTKFSVSSVKVSIGEPDDGIRTLGVAVHLAKTAEGTSKTYKKRPRVSEYLDVLYDEAKNKTIPTVEYAALYDRLAGLMSVKDDKVFVMDSVKGKARNLGGIVTAKVMRVTGAVKTGDRTYSVEVEIIPTRVVEGKYGPIVDGTLRRFKVDTPVTVPFTLTLTKK